MSTVEKYLKPEVIRQISRLDLRAQFIVKGFLHGLHASPFHGFSVEFAEHRLYNTGETTRHIDWKLFGRSDKLFVKRFEEETNLGGRRLGMPAPGPASLLGQSRAWPAEARLPDNHRTQPVWIETAAPTEDEDHRRDTGVG